MRQGNGRGCTTACIYSTRSIRPWKLLDSEHDTYCRLQYLLSSLNKYGVSFYLPNISSHYSREAAAWLYTRFKKFHRPNHSGRPGVLWGRQCLAHHASCSDTGAQIYLTNPPMLAGAHDSLTAPAPPAGNRERDPPSVWVQRGR
jgi:hypothetical protein